MRKNKLITVIALILAAVTLCCSCSYADVSKVFVAKNPRISATPQNRIKLYAENPLDDGFVISVNTFAYRTASELLKARLENSNYSPISVYFALAMLACGAEGKTEEELFALLSIDGKDNAYLATQMGNLYRRLFLNEKDAKLQIANSLWLSPLYPFEQDYVNTIKDGFYADLFSLDFAQEGAGKQMSKWISDNTYGKLNPELDVDKEQIMAIINTVYFIDKWANEFSKQATVQRSFYAASGEVMADFMSQTITNHCYYSGDGYTRVELAYQNGSIMSFVLPDVGSNPNDFFASPELLQECLTGGVKTTSAVTVQIPKYTFKSDYSTEQLKAMALRLGAGTMFTDSADFSDLSPQRSLVSAFQHGTYIKVDEEGTEAAGYTYIGNKATSVGPVTEPYLFRLDRPFIAAITSPEGVLLFVGITQNPSQS